MAWCPKCGYEYRNGFTECSDCGSKLVEQDPISRFGVPCTWLLMLELVLLFVLSFWVWFLLALVSSNAEIPMPLLPPTALVWGGSFIYGLIRRSRPGFGSWRAAVSVGAVLQVAAEILATLLLGGEAWKLIFVLPIGIVFSTIALALFSLGASLSAHR